MNTNTFEHKSGNILAVLGNPFRVRLVLALWAQEACVCHLEVLLKKRQAYISQHLMALREANLLETRRDGKFVYYRLANPAIVGTHWFQYKDQATTGRGDGENYQIGFIDICDTPYPEIVRAAREVGYAMYGGRFNEF